VFGKPYSLGVVGAAPPTIPGETAVEYPKGYVCLRPANPSLENTATNPLTVQSPEYEAASYSKYCTTEYALPLYKKSIS